MRTTWSLALTLAVAGCVHRTDAITEETLAAMNVLEKADIIDFDYQSHFRKKPNVKPFTLNAKKSFGKSLTLDLTLDKEVSRGVQDSEIKNDFYVGDIVGMNDATVAITFWASGLTGQINIGGTTIFIDKLDRNNHTVLYNQADVKISARPQGDAISFATMFSKEVALDPSVNNVTCTDSEKPTGALTKRSNGGLALDAHPEFVDEPSHARLTKRQGRRSSCEIAGVIDSSLAKELGSKRAIKTVLSLMKMVGSIFKKDLGVDLPVTHAFLDKDDNLRLGNIGRGNIGKVSDVLQAFSKAAERKQMRVSEDVCLMHLFTNRSFGATVGVAFVANPDKSVRGGICAGSAGVGVSTRIGADGSPLPFSAWATLVAHEMGHGFGANHDEQTRCNGQGDVMAAAVDASDGTLDNFSECSKAAIRRVIAAKATCFK